MTDPTALPNLTGGAGPADGPARDETPLSQRVLEALRELGSPAEVDEDGDVTFLFDLAVVDEDPRAAELPEEERQLRLFVRCSDDDAQILRVFGQWDLTGTEAPTDQLTRLQVCNDVNTAFNLLKTAVVNDVLLVTSEHILPHGADVRGLLQIAVPLTVNGVNLWFQRAVEGVDLTGAQVELGAGEREGEQA